MSLNIFSKIKDFFHSLFSNKNKMLNEPQNNSASETVDLKNLNNETSTFDKLKEDSRIVDLEQRFLKGEISDKDISDEDAEKLKPLLIERKNDLEKKLNKYLQIIYDYLSKDQEFLEVFDKYENGELEEDKIKETTAIQIRLYKRALKLM